MKFLILWWFKHLPLLNLFSLTLFQTLLDIMISFLIILVNCLLINLALVNANIYYILLIVLLSYFNIIMIVDSISFCKELKITTIIILSHTFRFGVITIHNHFIKNWISVKIFITNFSKFFGLLNQE